MVKLKPRKWIAYVGPFGFPDGGAAARRILGNAHALVAAGYEVVILSGQTDECGAALRTYCKGIKIASMQERDAEHLPRPIRLARYALMGQRTRQWLSDQPIPPSAIILYSGYTPYLLQFTGWGRKRKIPVIFDAVEWYTAENALNLALSPYLWNIEFSMRLLNKRLDGIIAISSFLENYYKESGMNVVRVPPLLDINAITPGLQRKEDGRLKIAYTGSPGTKDNLDEMICAIMRIDPVGERIAIDIAGLDKGQVLSLPGVASLGMKKLPESVRAHGYVPHDQALELVRNADFSMFLRRRNRVSTAGFPTKFVESFAVGTPVISTITSDLGQYLLDGQTGVICNEDASVESLSAALSRALRLESDDHEAMQMKCRVTAQRHFDYTNYAALLGAFIEEVKTNNMVI
ncbi:MAG: group 1 glycosyl transferase [Hyphomicrobiales bacterium]|nr:MAG: group 1 glycosyl transferase [Hyphomicrobiales bacterium]